MSATKLILMLIVLLGGALFLWRSDQEEQLKLALSPEESPLLFPNIQPSDLTKLTVEGPPPGFVLSHLVGPVLSPAAGTLKFELPVNTELDPEKGSAYLRSLLSLRALNTVEGEELTKDSGVYGLNPPTLTVTATLKIAASALNATGKSLEKNLEDNPAENLEQTHAQTLEFGKAHPFSGRRYLRLRGSEKILLVEEALFSALNRSATDLRQTKPLARVNLGTAVGLTLVRESSRLVFTRETSTAEWLILEEHQDGTSLGGIDADASLLTELTERLSQLTAVGFIDKPTQLKDYGLDTPRLRLLVRRTRQATETPIEVRFGEVRGAIAKDLSAKNLIGGVDYFMNIMGEPTIFRLAKRPAPDLFQQAMHFRNRKPFRNLDLAQLQTIKLEHRDKAKESFELVRDAASGRWQSKDLGKVLGKDRGKDRNKDRGKDAASEVEPVNTTALEKWVSNLRDLAVLDFPAISQQQGELFLSSPELLAIVEFSTPQAQPVTYTFMVGVPVSAQLDSPVGAAAEAPRYGALKGADGLFTPVIVRQSDLDTLRQTRTYFTSKAGSP